MAFISQTAFNDLKEALAKYGYTLLDSNKPSLEALFHKVSDQDTNQVIDAIAKNLNLHGAAGIMQNPLRNALTGAEPAIDNMINSNIDGGFDALESWLQKIAGVA